MKIELSKEMEAQAVASIRRYFEENLPEPLGELPAGLLLRFFVEEIGPLIYNQAIADAQVLLERRIGDLSGELYGEPFGYWVKRDAKRRQ